MIDPLIRNSLKPCTEWGIRSKHSVLYLHLKKGGDKRVKELIKKVLTDKAARNVTILSALMLVSAVSFSPWQDEPISV